MRKSIFFIFIILLPSAYSQTWVQKLNGISMWSLCVDNAGNIYAGTSGTVKSIYKSTNGGENWTEVLSGSPSNFLWIACDSLNNIYAANVSNGIMKSTNGGANFTNIPSSNFDNKNVNAVCCGRDGLILAGVTTGGVYRSTNGGLNFTNTALSAYSIVSFLVDRFNPQIIYAGSSSTSLNGFYRSTDGGLTFSSTLNPVNIWAIIQRANGNLYTGSTSTGYPFDKSTNGGLNWATISNFPGAVRGLCLDAAGNIYSSGNGGVFKSTNDGVSFSNHNFTYTSNHIVSFQNKILVAAIGTSNGGVWIFTDTTLTKIADISSSPTKFSLSQNYPNPFNPVSVFEFAIPHHSYIQIKCFDVQGKLLKIFLNTYLSRGKYKYMINAHDFPSGIYFYIMEADNIVMTRKFAVLK